MAYICQKKIRKRTVLVQPIVEDVVSFLGHSVYAMYSPFWCTICIRDETANKQQHQSDVVDAKTDG